MVAETAVRVASDVAEISTTVKELGAQPAVNVVELTLAVASLASNSPRRNPMAGSKRPPVFDAGRFAAALDAVRQHRNIATFGKLAEAIGVDDGVLKRMLEGKSIDFASALRIVAWSNLDLRQYIPNGTAS